MRMHLDLGSIFFIIIVDFKIFGKHILPCGKGGLQLFLHGYLRFPDTIVSSVSIS